VHTVRRAVSLREDLKAAKAGHKSAREELAKAQRELQANRSAVRSLRAEVHDNVEPIRTALAAAEAEIAALRRLYEHPDDHPSAAAMRAARRGGGTALGAAQLTELVDAVGAVATVGGELWDVDSPDPGAAVVLVAAGASGQRVRMVAGAESASARLRELLSELGLDPRQVAVVAEPHPGDGVSAVALAHLSGCSADRVAATLPVVAGRLARGGRIAVGRYREDPTVAAAVEAYLDAHAGLVRRPGLLMHLVSESD